jgi:hypothetical protein
MAWYWYIIGSVTTITFISIIVNFALISGFAKVTITNPTKEKIHIVYNWENDSGPISRAG